MGTASLEPAVSARPSVSQEPLPAGLRPHVWWLVGIIGPAFAYAVIRYNVFKGVAWEHLPLYITNKAFSLSAVVLIALSYLCGKSIPVHSGDPARRTALVKFLGLAGFSLAAMHALMSLTLLSPLYFEKFFGPGGKLNFTGELSILFGVLSLWCLTIPAITSLPRMTEELGGRRWKRLQQMGYAALLLNCGHVLVMGFAGWLEPATWPGALPPITMVAFVIGAAAVLAKMLRIAGARPA